MAIAVVGTPQFYAASLPALTGLSDTAGNLLVQWGLSTATTSGATISNLNGWTVAYWLFSGSNGSAIFAMYKIAAGSDSAPTWTSAANVTAVLVGEFSGASASTPLDQTPASVSNFTASPATATNQGADVASGDLVLYAGYANYSKSATQTNSVTVNNAGTLHDTNNNSTSTGVHYNVGWGLTTANSSADSASLTFNTSKITAATVGVCSFQAGVVAAITPYPSPRVSQAVNRSLNY